MNKEITLKIKVDIDDLDVEKYTLTPEEESNLNNYIEEKVVSRIISYCWVSDFIQVFPKDLPATGAIFDVKSIERI